MMDDETVKRVRLSLRSEQIENKMSIPRAAGIDSELFISKRLELASRVSQVDEKKLWYYEKPRLTMVDFICTVGEEFKLRRSTYHVAVTYFDRILSNCKISSNRMILVGIACVILAAKFEEPFNSIPSSECLLDFQMSKSGGNSPDFSKRDIYEMELLIFQGLEYRLLTITAAHLVDLYESLRLTFSSEHDDRIHKPGVSDKLIVRCVNKYCDFFVDLALQNAMFQSLSSVLVANAAVSCARRAYGVHPVWSELLGQTVQCEFDDALRSVHDQLWIIYDSGYRKHQKMSAETVENLSITPNSADSPLGPADVKVLAL